MAGDLDDDASPCINNVLVVNKENGMSREKSEIDLLVSTRGRKKIDKYGSDICIIPGIGNSLE
jgi:hypothetical protein